MAQKGNDYLLISEKHWPTKKCDFRGLSLWVLGYIKTAIMRLIEEDTRFYFTTKSTFIWEPSVFAKASACALNRLSESEKIPLEC